MAYNTASFNQYVETHQERFLQEFSQFIGQPSVAAEGRGVHEMADLVEQRFSDLGADVTRYETTGSPIIYAEIGPKNAARTLMIYNHYDVQPEDPIELWESPPYEMQIRDGVIYGRGTSDDKGELLSRIQSVEAWLKTQGELPVRIKWVIEGEEEVSSINLERWAKDNAPMLKADGLLWEGGGYDEAGRMQFGLGCKGIAYFELRCKGPNQDLHSSVAPMVINPAWRLIWALSTLKDQNDNITVDHYQEHIAPLTDEEIAAIDAVPMEFDQMMERWGLDSWLNGMDNETARRQYFAAPTLTICGINSGYVNPGPKTVLPAEAMVKLDFRLVPNLTPELVEGLLREHLDRRGFTDITIQMLGGESPAKSPANSLIHRASVAASLDTWGKDPIIFPWLAGSGPMYPLSTMLGIPVIFAGATWHPNMRAHSPNENIFVSDYFDSMRFTASLIAHFAEA